MGLRVLYFLGFFYGLWGKFFIVELSGVSIVVFFDGLLSWIEVDLIFLMKLYYDMLVNFIGLERCWGDYIL